MRRIISMLLLLPLLFLSLSGCWNRRELNDLAIASAVGLDKVGDQYSVTVQVVNPKEIASSKTASSGIGAPVSVYTETSDTIFEALRKLTRKSPREVYIAHLRVLVIGETLAEEGVGNSLDFVSRDPEARTDFPIIIASGAPAEKILRIFTSPMEMIPANKMFKSLEDANRLMSGTGHVTLDQLLSEINSDGKQPVVSGIRIAGEADAEESESKANVEKIKPKGVLQFQGLAVLKEDKLQGWLSNEESIGYSYVVGKVESTVRSVSCPDGDGGKVVLETIRTKTKMEGAVVNGRPTIHLKVSSEENVGEIQCGIDVMKDTAISELQHLKEQDIKDVMEKVIHKAQKEYKSDIFGFGEAIHRGEPKQWRRLKDDWEHHFSDLQVNIEVDVKIRRLGTILQPAKKQ